MNDRSGSSLHGGSERTLSPLLAATEHIDMDNYCLGMLDLSGYSPDLNMLKTENNSLRSKLSQMEKELHKEQDIVFSLRKKLNSVEKERLDAVAKLNGEASHLDGELTKLRAQLERGETVRQNLEFQLAKARKEIGFEKKTAAERQTLICEANDELKQKVSELTSQLEHMSSDITRSKHHHDEDAARLCDIINEKEKKISEYRIDRDSYDTERDHLNATIQQKDKVITSLESNIHEIQIRERQLVDANRQQASDLELIHEKEQRLRHDYEILQERIRSLEEGIEAERAAHLESKFNSEIVQLRIRDLENALQLEKTARAEAVGNAELMTKKLRELQHVYDDERKSCVQTREKLENAEKEYAILNRQLHHELEDKRLVIQKLSGQLDVHQKNFDELRQELNKAKKRQIFLEESYNGTTKELEILLDNFSMDRSNKSAPDKTTKKKTPVIKKKETKSQSLAVLLEGVRHLLMDYKRGYDDLKADMARVRSQNEEIVHDCQQYKDVLWAKDKALESTQQGMSETSKELRKLQTEMREIDGVMKKLQDDLNTTQRDLDKERKSNKALTDQLNKINTKCKATDQVSLEFMQALYRQLQFSNKSSAKDQQLLTNSTCWTDLALYVNDQVAALITVLRRSEEKVAQMEDRLGNQNRESERLQRLHEEQMNELASIAESRTKEWQQQKAEMEKHYTQLMSEIHSRQKKMQAQADQAWEKVRMTGSVQHGLEAECTQLRTQLALTQREHDTLLAAFALLTGAFYPLYVRYNALISQRQLLNEQANNFLAFKHEVQMLVEALSGDGGSQPVTFKGRGLLRFRRSVLAVIMANRLVNSSQGSCKMFTATDALPGLYHVLVCTGYVEPISKKYTGVSNRWLMENDKIVRHGQGAALSWMTSGDLMGTVTTTMTDLYNALQQAKQGDSSVDSSKLVAVSKSCFQKFLCHLPCIFPTLQQADVTGAARERNLVCRLGQGLHRTLDNLHPENSDLSSALTIITSLQQCMLQFTQRLHDAEVERRDLRVEVTSLRQQYDVMTEHIDSAQMLEHEVVGLRNKVENVVSRERFEKVCEELNKALQREQQAQLILSEQGEQLQQLGVTLDIQRTEDDEKEFTLAQAVQGLTEARMELKRQEQRLRQQNKQVQILEEEKKALINNIQDAEHALKTAARDRESLTLYVKSVEKAIELIMTEVIKVSSSSSTQVDFARLLSPELVPQQLGKPGADFKACQQLVSVFVDCQNQLYASITALRDEIQSHRQHIEALKQELGAACRREFNDEFEKMKLEEYNLHEEPIRLTDQGTRSHDLETAAEDEFILLIGDSSDSVKQPSMCKPAQRAKASTNKGQCLKYQSPPSSHRNSRRKTTEGKV